MVTKHSQVYIYHILQSYSSKNPYGNKTQRFFSKPRKLSYSSKNPYGNKTQAADYANAHKSYSSKNPYGNKT